MGACSSKPKTTELEAAIDARGEIPQHPFKENHLREDNKTSVQSICRNIPSMCCMRVLLIETKAGAVSDMLVETKEAGFHTEGNLKKLGKKTDQPCIETLTCQAAVIMKLRNDIQVSRSQEEPRELHTQPGFINPKTSGDVNQLDGPKNVGGDEVLGVEVLLEQCQGDEVIDNLLVSHNRLDIGTFSDTNMEPNFPPTTLYGTVKEADLMQLQEACKETPISSDVLQVLHADLHYSVQNSETCQHTEVSKPSTESVNPIPAKLAHDTNTISALCSDVTQMPWKASTHQERPFSNADEKEPTSPALRDPNMICVATGEKNEVDAMWAYQVEDANGSSAKHTSAHTAETDDSTKLSYHKGSASDLDEVLEKLASEFERQESLSSSSRVLS